MPSSTDVATHRVARAPRRAEESWRGAARDLGHLLHFRARTVRRRVPAVAGVSVVLLLTWMFATAPADRESVTWTELRDTLAVLTDSLVDNLGVAFAAVIILGIGSSMTGGGGRELLSRSELSVHPVGPLTEHLGALVLSPVNLAWLIQLWGLLALTALVAPPGGLLGAQVVVVLWVLAGTALAQVVGWVVEGVRRLEHGVVVVRASLAALGLVAAGLHLTGHLIPVVAALPTTWMAETALSERWPWAAAVAAAAGAVAVWAGSVPARWALGEPPREELRADSGVHEARHLPAPRWLSLELALLLRLDRGSVWRSVGMRRGLIVLGLGPGLVAVVTGMAWSTVLMMPGLAASGAALLFGVNNWCLDGKGMIWRETLPVEPRTVWAARTRVTAECLVLVSAITVSVAALRGGLPALPVGVAVLTCWLVVVVQVLAVSMSWSVRNPFSVDLSSPRATPAPHAVMAGYAARLSLTTTTTSMLFAGLASLDRWWLPLAFAPPFLAWSGLRLWRARRRWLDAAHRARIVLTVAAV